MRHSLGQDILNNMFLFFLIIIAELQELPPVCVASLMDVLYYRHYCYLSRAMTRLLLIGTFLSFISSPLLCCHKPQTSDPSRAGSQDYIWWHVAHHIPAPMVR